MAEGSDEGLAPETAYGFGRFQLLPRRKLLRRDGEPVRLGARATDLLIALVERAGEVLSREELEARVWPRVVVEETSLRVHMSALRRALNDGVDGARYITNVPGRGYGFVAPVTRLNLPDDASASPAAADQTGTALPHNLPTRLSSVVGREAGIEMLVEQLGHRRLASVLGPGGIGKTTVAIAAAARFASRHPEYAACLVDLSLTHDPTLVPATLAAAFGLVDFPDDPVAAVAQLLGDRPMLLVLDNCEQVVDAVADTVGRLLARAPGVRLLLTSRERIGLEGEWQHRLSALDLPIHAPTAAQALTFSALRLFVDRARARAEGFELTDADAPLVADLCRRLDGIPLAIEIAAARLEQFGLRGLIAQVDAGFLHLKRGRRSGAQRHEALSAMLDWSHRLLTPAEQVILRRVAVFRSPFSLRSALRVAEDEALGGSEVINGLAGLRAKSLLNRVVLDDVVKHQLLEQTRAYALEKLAESTEENAVRRRHALLVQDLLVEAQRNWPTMPKRRWVALHGTLLPAIRTALNWAFSPSGGDPLIGASLTARCWPMARFLFLEDYEASIERAIQALNALDAPPLELMIQLHLGRAAHLQERNGTGPATREAYDRAAALAKQSPDPAHGIEAEIGQVLDAMGSGDAPRALAATARMGALARASGNGVAQAVADRLTAQALHFHGDHRAARQLALAVRGHEVQRGALASLAGIVDHRVSMEILLARTLWLTGFPDQAAASARNSLALAESDSTLAVCQALAFAVCPIALWRGDDGEARIHAGALLAQAQKLAGGQWLVLARGYLDIAESRLSGVAARPTRPGFADGPARFPFAQDQLAAIDASHWDEDCLARARAGRAGWCAPEMLRLHALRLAAAGSMEEAGAELQRSLDLARSQGAAAWVRRSAASLAQLQWQREPG